jgi:hypothetical protein
MQLAGLGRERRQHDVVGQDAVAGEPGDLATPGTGE